jgi:hypothetical protein
VILEGRLHGIARERFEKRTTVAERSERCDCDGQLGAQPLA